MSLLLLLAAAAQPAPQSVRVSPDAARVIVSWGRCTARSQTRATRALLAMDFRTDAYWSELGKLARKAGQCLYPGEVLRFRGSLLFAGALAEGLYERDDLSGAGLAARVEAAPAIAARDGTEVIGLCVARRDPIAVRAVLATRPASDDERAAMGALKTTLAGCVPAGLDVRFGRPALRSLVALGLYRLTARVAFASPERARHA